MLAAILDYIKREDFKKEMRDGLAPVFTILADQAKPYFAYVVILLAFHFSLLICICFYLIKLKNVTPSLTIAAARPDGL
jgi:hypothetical protein